MVSSELDRAKQYSNIKYVLAIIDIIYVLLLLFLFQGLGISRFLAQEISFFILAFPFKAAIYLLVVSLGYYFLSLPINIYQSFILEHKFSLSEQRISNWVKDQIKAWLISYIVSVILLEAFYYIIRHYPNNWWWVASLFWIFFSLILAKLTPIIIIPLFFKYKRLSDEGLRQRIINLADRMRLKILDCFEINLSSRTVKANAAFVGWGATRRVILADTLKDKYSLDEIEVILAHEFAHYRLRHLFKLILIHSFSALFISYIMFETGDYVSGLFGSPSLFDVANLPVIIMYLVVFGIVFKPLENYISRRFERNADKAALQVTRLRDAFISMMDKLSTQNLADRNPHPLIKLFFFDHPPIEERIAMAKSFQ